MTSPNNNCSSQDKSFCFCLYIDWKRFRGKNFKLLYNLMRELTKQVREDIASWIGLFCPLCFAGADKIYRDGAEGRKHSSQVTRYCCSVCGNHFCDRTLNPFYRKHYPEIVILSSLVLYYELERSPEEISRSVGIPVKEEGMKHPVAETINSWIEEYSCLFAMGGRSIPLSGEFREADELYKRIDGIRAYTLGIESRESKFVVLEDCWSNDKNTLKEFLRIAISRFRKVPPRCDTDGWHGYDQPLKELGIEHGVVYHFREWKSVEGYHTNSMERFWESYRSWERKARGYKRIENSSVYTVAYETFHNFLRPHMSLDKRTPYEHHTQANPHISWHYIVVRGLLSIEPGWKKEELKTLHIPD